ncbi:MAG TPA: sulfotransferase [Burkholderiales bacterium]|nr:sulfotransferase [Burkholderiales bacterium]
MNGDGREALRSGRAAGESGDLAAAAAHFERALEENPRLAAAHYNLGLCHAASGDMQAAAEAFGRAAGLAPRHAAAHEHQGSALNALGDYAGAAQCFERALHLEPRNPRALAWLGASRQLAGDLDAAEQCYRRALAIDPGDADANCNLGKLRQASGRADEAARHFERALAADPRHAVALAGLALHLDRQGRHAEALERLEAADGARSPEIVIASARALRRLGRHAEAAAALEALLVRRLPLDAQVQAQFSLARCYDALGRTREAAASLERGNALKPARYDHARQQAATDSLMRVFSAAGLARLPRSGNASERPVFVVGMPRAGKSLVEQILASHPDIAGAGELTALGELTAGPRNAPWPDSVQALAAEELARMAGEYLDTLSAADAHAARVIDTLPGNFVHVGLVELLFPRARVVHVTRDARDLALACWFTNFAGRSQAFAFDIAGIAAYLAEYRRLMRHWREVSGLDMLEVAYEDLVDDTAGVSRRMIEFLGLPWDDACLRYFEPGVATLAAGAPLREPVDAREVGWHEHYRPFIDLDAFMPDPG